MIVVLGGGNSPSRMNWKGVVGAVVNDAAPKLRSIRRDYVNGAFPGTQVSIVYFAVKSLAERDRRRFRGGK